MKQNVFVYGTLKRGFLRHSAIEHCKYIGDFETEPNYSLFEVESASPFPALIEVEPGEGVSVSGEVYEVDEETMITLDQIECAPYLYKRGKVNLQNFSDDIITYFYQRPTTRLINIGDKWQS